MTTARHSLVPRNVMTLPAQGNDPRNLRTPVRTAASHPCTSGCTGCPPCRAKQGMGTIDLSTLGLGGYLALGLGAYVLTKVLFTGDRAKQRRSALRNVDAEFRKRRAEVAAQYPRI